MLKKLRIKFILVNMTFVLVMLSTIFVLLYYVTAHNLERESMQMMGTVAMDPMKMPPPDSVTEEVRRPYFTVMLNQSGEVTGIKGSFFDVSDKEMMESLVQKVKQEPLSSGVLKADRLRFMKVDNPIGKCIVFADISNEKSVLKNLIRTFVLTGTAVMLVFGGISFLLAYLAVKPVERAWKKQKQFVADASHELKTPLTVIMTDVELLCGQECSDKERQQLSSGIITMSVQMKGLVESMLELARIDGGIIQKNVENLLFSEIVGNAAMIFEPVFFEKECVFSYEIEPDIIINGNKEHLKQLVDILLDNAGKYTISGGEVHLTLKRKKNRHCLLMVSNQGESISKEEIEHLFERFYRGDKARTRNQSYGLGLSIAKSIVKEHHGRIWAESQNGYNRFFVEIRYKESKDIEKLME